jgi:hypothetical protein
MSKPFEIWAPEQIARLRTEADALERSLKLYLESAKAEQNGPPPKSAPEGTKIGRVLDWIRSASPRGRTLSEIYQFCLDQGIKSDRAHVRSMIWYAEKRGQVERRGDQYVAHVSASDGVRMLETELKETLGLN